MDFPHKEYNRSIGAYAKKRAASVPKELFRYRSCDSPFFKEELVEFVSGNIYFPSRNTLNDPHDCKPNFRRNSLQDFKKYIMPVSEIEYSLKIMDELECSFSQARKLFRSRSRKWHESFMLKLYKKDSKRDPIAGENLCIVSLTSQPTNDVMWSTYCNRFTGYVQAFEIIPSLFGVWPEPSKVEYSDEKVTIDYFGLYGHYVWGSSLFTQHLKPHVIKKFRDNMHQKMWMLQKSQRWAYEEEYRVVCYTSPGYSYQHCLRPSYIIVGSDTKSEHLKEIKSVGLPIYEARPAVKEYGVEIRPLD